MNKLRWALVIILMALIGFLVVYIQAGISVIDGWGAAATIDKWVPVRMGLVQIGPFILLDTLGIVLCSIKINKSKNKKDESEK